MVHVARLGGWAAVVSTRGKGPVLLGMYRERRNGGAEMKASMLLGGLVLRSYTTTCKQKVVASAGCKSPCLDSAWPGTAHIQLQKVIWIGL